MELANLLVGVGDGKVTRGAEDVLVTYALGSCIGVAIYDPVARVGGMLHIMLPESSIDPSGARDNPWRYADTGTPLLFRTAYRYGALKERLVVRIAGGAAVFDDRGLFNIGKRNHAALRKILWQAGVRVDVEEVGGAESRTMSLEVASGRCWIKNAAGVAKEMTSQRMAAVAVGREC